MIRIYLKILELWNKMSVASGERNKHVAIVLALLICAVMLVRKINELIK